MAHLRPAIGLLLLLAGGIVSCKPAPSTPQEVIARMTNAYATCRSYQDSGESVIIPSVPTPPGIRPLALTNSQPFSIQFRRPSSLRFEFAHQEEPKNVSAEQIRHMADWPQFKCVLWSNGQQTRIYSEKTGSFWDGDSLSNGIAQIMALSQGRGDAILNSIVSPTGGCFQFYLHDLTSMREDVFEGTKCYVLSGNIGGTPPVMELWVGKKDLLLRRRRIIIDRAGHSSISDENHRNIRINDRIPDRVFTFDLPGDARATTNPLSLLPDVEERHAAMHKLMENPPRGTQFTGRAVSQKVIPLTGAPEATGGSASHKLPSYVDCSADRVTIHPGGKRVTWAELQSSDNEVTKLLDRIERNTGEEYLVVMVRPGSVKFYRQVRNLAARRCIDVGYDVVDADFIVDWDEAGKGWRANPPTPWVTATPTPPLFKPLPRPVRANKQPVFFECRNNEVCFIDKEGLDKQVAAVLSTLSLPTKQDDIQQFLKAMQGREIGNEYYKVNPTYLLAAIMAVEPRADVHGDSVADLDKPDAKFRATLAQLAARSQCVTFLVHDDSFTAFRRARSLAGQAGFETGWELLGSDEPIKFGQGGAQIVR